VGYPLLLHRQYAKNIGRQLSITLNSGEVQKGTLSAVDETKLVLGPLPLKKIKGKRPSKKQIAEQPENVDVLFSSIKEAKVIII
jgi:ribosome maturation factor RimP